MPGCQRRGLRPRWPRAVVLALGIIGGGKTGAPPHLPRGWTMYDHQGTPYFYNEYTGETTWDQPVPSPEETRDKQVSTSGRMEHLLSRDQARETSSPRGKYSTSSGIPASKRGWFGLGRGAAKPQRQGATPQRWETRRTARNPTGITGYAPTEDRDVRGPSPREWTSDQGDKEIMSPQQRSGGGSLEGPDSRFSDGRLPVYDPQQEVPELATDAWVGEGGVGTAELWGDYAKQVKVQPSGTADRTVEGSPERDRRTRDGKESPVTAMFTGPAPVAARGSYSEPVDSTIGAMDASRSGDFEWWAGDTTAIGAAVIDGAEQRADKVPGLEGDTGVSTGQIGTAPERSHNGTSVTFERGQETDNVGTRKQEPKMQPQTIPAEDAGDGTAPLHAATKIAETEQAVAGASEQTSPTLGKEQPPRGSGHDDVVNSPWAQETASADAGSRREQGRSTVPAGERHTDTDASQASSGELGGYHATEAWSAGKSGTPLGQEGSLWGDGFPSQRHLEQEQGGKGTRQDAGGWDWSDPWGQEGAWGTPVASRPACGVGTDETRPHHIDGLVPTSDAHSQGADDSTAQPTGEERVVSGWGVSVDQTEVGDQSSKHTASNDVATASTRRKELEELARALTETRKELEDARNVEEGLRSALSEQQQARAKANAAAVFAREQAERVEALVRQREEDAKENATAVGQWLVTLGLEQQELKGQLAVAVSNSTLLAQELGTLRQTARQAELRANSSEAKLKVALEDVEVLDEGLKQYMDGDGRRRSPRPSRDIWWRVSEAYLRPLLPSKLKTPSPEELEVAKLDRSLGRALENNSALAEAVKCKDELVKDLNSRIEQFQLQAVRRRKGYRALKIGLADLTHEVQAKESMVIILVVVVVRTASILEDMNTAINAQREDFECLASLSRDQQKKMQSLALEVENGAMHIAHLQESLNRADSALSAIAVSLGAGEACVQRWKDADGQESETVSEDSLLELLREIHAAAASKFANPLGLEPTTGAMTVAVPRTVSDQTDNGGNVHSQKRTFWGSFLDALCCRRRG